MPRVLDPIQFVLIALAGWMNERQLQTIEYLREENRVLREQLGDRRLRFNDDQRRRLATKARGLGRRRLAELVLVQTSELAWAATMTGMPARQRTPELFKGLHFDHEVVILCVRWYLSYKLSSR